MRKEGLDPSSVRVELEKNSKIKIDDVLDSMALFIMALRIAEGNHLCFKKTSVENSDDNGKIFI